MRSVLVGLAVLAVVGACSAHANERTAPRVDRTTITQAQFAENHFNSAFDAVAALRANWFNLKGPDSFSRPSAVRVYLNEVLLGDTATLRTIPAVNITYIKYLDGVAATGRWGVDHAAGVIYVSTQPVPSDKKP